MLEESAQFPLASNSDIGVRLIRAGERRVTAEPSARPRTEEHGGPVFLGREGAARKEGRPKPFDFRRERMIERESHANRTRVVLMLMDQVVSQNGKRHILRLGVDATPPLLSSSPYNAQRPARLRSFRRLLERVSATPGRFGESRSPERPDGGGDGSQLFTDSAWAAINAKARGSAQLPATTATIAKRLVEICSLLGWS
jgi:hypothetical protein